MLVSRKVIRWSAVPLALAVSAGVLVATQPAGALVTPREGVWELAITGGTAEFESDYDVVTLRPNGSAFSIYSVRDDEVNIPFTLSASGKAYVSDWTDGLGEACGLVDDPTEEDAYVYVCLPAEVKFTLPRVIEKRMRGTVEVRAGSDLSSVSSVVLTYSTSDALPPTEPRALVASRPFGVQYTFSSELSWQPPAVTGASAVERYRIELRREDGSGSGWELELLTDSTRAVLEGLKPSSTYAVHVSAENSEGVGPPARTTITTPGADDLPWVVSLGDSFISGEGGRWAGNADVDDHSRIDALGPSAYWDGDGKELIEDCHRSQSAMIHIGKVRSKNFACSGAITRTEITSSMFKPGIDFYRGGNEKFPNAIGQAQMLEDFARTHDIRMVVLSIGGNNLNFGKIIEDCLAAFLAPGGVDCRDNPQVAALLADRNVDQARSDIAGAMVNVHTAMTNAGIPANRWTLVSTLYPQPMAGGGDMRYPEDLGIADLDRQYEGGCGFSNVDATWANIDVLALVNRTVREAAVEAKRREPSLRITHMDSSNAYKGRNLCHKGVKRVNDDDEFDVGGPRSWRERTAVNRSEWVVEIEISNASETMLQEGVHPNYWGQLALRNCLRKVWNDGNPMGGTCVRGHGLNFRGEPNMSLKRLVLN